MAKSNIGDYNNAHTPEERKEHARRGGLAKGESYKKKRLLKEYLQAILDCETAQGKTYAEEISFSLIQKALDGDTKAFEVIRDSIGQKPKDEIELNNSNITINIDDTTKS